jgi:hypothetical protein
MLKVASSVGQHNLSNEEVILVDLAMIRPSSSKEVQSNIVIKLLWPMNFPRLA